MSLTYTWTITGMKTNDADAVVQTYWKKTGTDTDGNVGSFSGATPFKIAEGQELVPLDRLTEEQVLDWIKSVVVGDYEVHVNGQIVKDLNRAKAVVKDIKLPWAPEEPAAPVVTEPSVPTE
jgi:hypothetical protein